MAVERTPSGSSLIDVLDRVLDKGIVIDAWVRVSLVGIDLVTVEARIVVASIDTYLKYSEAVGITGPVSRPRELSAGGAVELARGHGSLGVAGLETVTSWTLFPRPQPTFRGAPDLMPQARATELMRSQPATLVTHRERRFASAPDGVIILDTVLEGETFDEIAE